MRKTVTLLGVCLFSLLFSGVHELFAQKANPANLQKKNVITKNMFPEKLAPVMVAKNAAAIVKSTSTVNDQIIDENAFLQGQYVEVGISNCGCFGTTVTQPAGFHGNVDDFLGFVADPDKDGWNVGVPAYNGDYFLPGSPEEGWGIEIDGNNFGNFGQCGDFNIPGAVTSIKFENDLHTAIWEGELNGIQIMQDVSFKDDATYFVISATLTNTTSDTIRNLYYMRNVDPDNEKAAGGDYTTFNKIIYQADVDSCNRALAAGVGLNWGMFLGLGTADERARATFGGFSNRSASDIWNGNGFELSGEETNDIAISLSFKIGDLAPGESNVVMYTYVLDSSQVDEAIDAIVRLKANGNDITNTQIHSNCEQPVDLIVSGNPGFVWEWTNSPYLSDTIGDHVVFTAPLGTYNLSVTGTNACREVTFNFTIVIETDVTAPVVKAQETFITYFGKNDTAKIALQDIDMGSFDNCELDTIFISPDYFTKTDSGKIVPVILTAIDLNGLISRDTTLVSILSYEQYSILEKIIQYQILGDASGLTIEQLDSLGIDSVVVVNLGIYQDYISYEWPKTIIEFEDVQKIVTEANAIVLIRDMVDNGDASGLMLSTLFDVGASSAVEQNLLIYEYYLIDYNVWSKNDIKNAVSAANKFAVIDQMARDDDASSLTVSMLWNLNMWDAYTDYIDQYKTWIEERDSISNPDILEDLISQVNNFMDIVWMAENDDASGLYYNKLLFAGVTDPNEDNIYVYADSIENRVTFNTLQELQALIDLIDANEAFAKIVNMAVTDDASGLTEKLLNEVGVTLLFTEFMPIYQDSIAAADTFNNPLEVIQLIESINAKAAFILIQEMAINDDASGLTDDLITSAGATGNKQEYLDTYMQFVADADSIPTVEALQLLIDNANAFAAFHMIQLMAINNDASGLTTDLLTEAETVRLKLEYLGTYKQFVVDADSIPAVADLQALIDSANTFAAFHLIQLMATSNDASGLTIGLLTESGATGFKAEYLFAYKKFVADAVSIPTVTALNLLIENANAFAAFHTIQLMTYNKNAAALNTGLLTEAGITSIIEGNMVFYKESVEAIDTIVSVESLQLMINVENAWVVLGEMTYSNNVSSLTTDLLELLGATDVTVENLAFYKTFVVATDTIETIPALQVVIDKANTLSDLNGMAVANNASTLTAPMLTLPGGTGVVGANLFAYKLYLADASGVTTLVQLQDIIDAANAYAQIITIYNSGNTDAITIQMLVNAGILRTQNAKLPQYKSVIKGATSINNLADLQALIDLANETTGIELTFAEDLKIYPVPADNYLVIAGSFENARLITMDGKVVLNITSTDKLTKVDISTIKSGVYILETIKSSNAYQYMVIKK